MASAVSRVLQEDVGRLFMHPTVQRLLTAMTGFDVERVYSSRQTASGKRINLRLMTDSELQQANRESVQRAKQKLQMPPVMPPRRSVTRVLSRDPDIAGLDSSKIVFTDITPTLSHRSREVVVREPDGTLRGATWEERDRINQIYFPMPGRKIQVPKMFSEENLNLLLSRGGAYEYVLDSACIQFEPDDPAYLKVVHTTYDHCDTNSAYDDLRFTRHFGGFMFYLACSKKIDSVLVDALRHGRLQDAANLIHLFCVVWPECSTFTALDKAVFNQQSDHGSRDMTLVKAYLSCGDASPDFAPRLELAMQALEDNRINAAGTPEARSASESAT